MTTTLIILVIAAVCVAAGYWAPGPRASRAEARAYRRHMDRIRRWDIDNPDGYGLHGLPSLRRKPK